ncbi:MAG: nucleoside kinase [Lachnospiraceae bacterium]
MKTVRWNSQKLTFEDGATYCDFAARIQKNVPHRIVLVLENGKLRELFMHVTDGADVRPVTTAEVPGNESYRRTAEFIMVEAVRELQKDAKTEVCFSVSSGVFCTVSGVEVTQSWISQLDHKMREIIARDQPVIKRTVSTDEAIRRFREEGLEDKVRLFRYRRVSRVNVYELNGMTDYFYGYMLPSTGYVDQFHLYPYDDGFVLQMPKTSDPEHVPPFQPQNHVYRALRESSDWADRLKVSSVGRLNDLITEGRMLDLILIEEALMEKKMAQAADSIRRNSRKRVVMIAGPSSSGKTTFSHRLTVQLLAAGLATQPIEVDNYFKNRDEAPKDENGQPDLESIDALDTALLDRDVRTLLSGGEIEMPTFNFRTGKREYHGNKLRLRENTILIMEGIHCLDPRMCPSLDPSETYRIYISALTQLNVDSHNRIPTTDGRLIRRIVRDARVRGTSAAETIAMWPSVRKGEEKNIFPFQESADIVFNSALSYELSVLKPYAEPLLFGIGRDDPVYNEARRILKFLDYFVPVGSEHIPQNSILREFIGGSCFRV